MAMITLGVLALQGGVIEHLTLLRRAADQLSSEDSNIKLSFIEVRTEAQLATCDALIIPGGESTTMSIVSQRLGLLEPLRRFVKVDHKPVWGTCAGLVMLAEEASAVKRGGQELIGGLDIKVQRNRYGTQIQSFIADLTLPFLDQGEPFRGVFIRAPVVEKIGVVGGSAGVEAAVSEKLKKLGLDSHSAAANGVGGADGKVEVMGVYEDDIVAVRQGNVFGTSFHPELTQDTRIHVWWLRQVLEAVGGTRRPERVAP